MAAAVFSVYDGAPGVRDSMWRYVAERVPVMMKFALAHPVVSVRRTLLGAAWAKAPRRALARALPDKAIILEAGAADGSDTVWLQALPRVARLIAVEPHPSAAAELLRKTALLERVTVCEFALASADGCAALYESEDAGPLGTDSSSLLPPTLHLHEYPHVRFQRELRVTTRNLDSLLGELDLPGAHLLWLDLQGQEMNVLRSSPQAVAFAQAIYLEVSRRPLYEGACTASEIHAFMLSAGFRRRVNRLGRLTGNVLYTRSHTGRVAPRRNARE